MNELNFNNFNKLPDTSTTVTTTAVSYNKYCKYKLPCGMCELFKKACTIDTEHVEYINTYTSCSS